MMLTMTIPHWVGASVGRAVARHRQHRQAEIVFDALRRLDDWTLRDLGVDRSELKSIAAEATGIAERTRIRVIASAEAAD